MNLTTSEGLLMREVIRRAYINAKREKEASAIGMSADDPSFLATHWGGQEIAFEQLLQVFGEKTLDPFRNGGTL